MTNAASPTERLADLGLTLPAPTAPGGRYVKAHRIGDQLWLAGHGPNAEGWPVWTGKVPSVLGVEDARTAARQAALSCLATVESVIGSLDRVARVLKVFGMVNADPDFTGHPRVVDGASELLMEIFGPAGAHVRSAVGMASLPADMPVELEMVFELAEPLIRPA